MKAAPVRVETVEPGPLALTLALTGSVEAGRIAQLSSPAEGPVNCCVKVREGDSVTKGQVLLTLGHREGLDALVSSLVEDLNKEQDNVSRTRRLVEIGALPAEQADTAAASAGRARAQLVKAEESTRDYVLAAPWAGIVSKVKVQDGDNVAPRTPLIELYDPSSLIVRLAAPEQEAARLELDMSVEVELDAYPGERFAGAITRLYPYLDERTRTRMTEITLTHPPMLLPAMFARVKLVKEVIPDAITVPAYSLVAAPGGGYLAFVVEEGKAARRTVETGIEVEGRVHILGGLAAGDRLIVGGQEKLKDGAAVKAVELDGKKVGGEGAEPEAQAKPGSEGPT